MRTDLQDVPGEPPMLEQMGALCSLLVHELANYMCIVSGNATFAQMSLDDRDRLEPAIQAIVKAGELAGHVLSRCGDLRRGFADKLPRGDVPTVLRLLQTLADQHPGWTLNVSAGLAGRLRVPSAWVAFAMKQVLAETGVDRGAIEVTCGTSGPDDAADPNQPFLRVQARYEAARAFSIQEARSRYDNFGLLAAFELIRNCGGKLEGLAGPGGKQEILIAIPIEP